MSPALLSRRGAISGSLSNTLIVNSPIAPSESNYTIPTPDVTVSNITDLASEVIGTTPKIIKVLNGAYSRSAELVAGAAHKIYCESANGVTFDFGFRFNYIIGWEFHGGSFTIPTIAKAANDGSQYAALVNWYGSVLAAPKITDVTINGSGVLTGGIHLGSTHGVIIERVKVTNVISYGVFVSDVSTTSTAVISRIWDIDVANVFRSPRGAADGTAEAGLWIGHQVVDGVRRIKIRNTGWQGIAFNNLFNDTAILDVDVDTVYGTVTPAFTFETGNGIYFERNCHRITLDNFKIGPDLHTAINGEWDNGVPGNAAMNSVAITNGHLSATRAYVNRNGNDGIYLGEGSDGCSIRNCVFIGMDWACIAYPLNTNTSPASFTGNDYTGRAVGCVKGTIDNRNTVSPTETFA